MPKKKLDMPDLKALKNTSASLLTSTTSSAQIPESSHRIYEIPINQLFDNPKNGRKKYNENELDQMAESIKDTGFRGVVEVIKHPENPDAYTLIYGHKRKRAAKLAGLKTMPCLVIKEESLSSRKASFYENFIRSDISKIEQAIELKTLKEDFDDITNVELAKMTNMSEGEVSRLFKLLELPEEVQNAIDQGKLSFGHAKRLLPLLKNEEEKLISFALKSIKKDWSIKELITNLEKADEKQKKPNRKETSKVILDLEESLKSKYQFGVMIRPSKNEGGKIVLPYSSEDELQTLINLLK